MQLESVSRLERAVDVLNSSFINLYEKLVICVKFGFFSLFCSKILNEI